MFYSNLAPFVLPLFVAIKVKQYKTDTPTNAAIKSLIHLLAILTKRRIHQHD